MSACIRPAVDADGPRILDLVARTPQRGLVTLNFERDPDFFLGARVTCEQPEVWVAAAEDEHLLAVFNIGRRTIFVNGEPRLVRYAHDLRVAPEARGTLLLHRMFRQLRRVLVSGEWMQTVILAENRQSIDTVGSGRAGLPVYYPCGDIETSLVATSLARAPRLPADMELARATPADLPALQAFLDAQAPTRQFCPRYRLDGLLAGDGYFNGLRPENFLLARRRGAVVGVLGDWDQGAFKKTRVLEYPGVLAWLRPLYNLLQPIAGGVRLPPAGGTLRYRMLHTLLVRDGDPDLFRLLLDRQRYDHRHGTDALVIGAFRGDPLLAGLGGLRRRTQLSHHYLVSYDGDPRDRIARDRTPHIELARL